MLLVYHTISFRGKTISLSLGKRLRLVRIFRPCYNIWPSLWCHTITTSSWLVEVTVTFVSCNMSPKNMYTISIIFYTLIITKFSFTTFKILPSIWILHPKSFDWSIDNRFSFESFIYSTSWIVCIILSYKFILTIPTTKIYKAWYFLMNTDSFEICS